MKQSPNAKYVYGAKNVLLFMRAMPCAGQFFVKRNIRIHILTKLFVCCDIMYPKERKQKIKCIQNNRKHMLRYPCTRPKKDKKYSHAKQPPLTFCKKGWQKKNTKQALLVLPQNAKTFFFTFNIEYIHPQTIDRQPNLFTQHKIVLINKFPTHAVLPLFE